MAKLSKIAKASVILMIGTVLSKILGFARELLVAYRFGAGSISDAFILTNGIPTLLFASLATAININYIPFYHRIETQERRNRFTSNLATLSAIVMLIGCVIVNLFPRVFLKIFATGLPEETEQYAVLMLRIVVFSILPIILSHLYQALLQANESFSSTALYGILTNITVIVFTFLATEEKYYVLSIGTIASHLIGLGLILLYVRKKTDYRYTLCADPKDPLLKELIVLTLPLVLEDLASSLSLLADRNLASFLDKGTISGLSYAGTIGNIASTMIATAIITATFPAFSKLLAEGKKEQFSVSFEKYASVISYILAPISVFMVFNAHDIVTFIFQHGAFDGTATKIVAESMLCYAAGVLPMGLQSYLIRGFYAIQDTKTPVKIKVFALASNIVLNLASVRFLAHKGIALSTSISYVIAYFLLLHSLKKKHGIDNLNAVTRESGAALALSLLPAAGLYLLFHSVIGISVVLIRLLLSGALFVGVYAALMLAFRKEKMANLLRVLHR